MNDARLKPLVACLLSLLTASAALAQNYPDHAITMVLPYPPGGTTDAMGRITAKRLEAELKVPVIVENKGGASGAIGSEFVRRAAPDGYTLLFNASIFLLGRSVLKAVPYDPQTDFTPLARVGQTPLLVLANINVPGNTIKEFVAAARAKPDSFNFSNSAAGSAGHLATIEFNHVSGLNLQIVTYRGSAQALTDLMGGHVQLMIDPPGVAMTQVKAGKLKALAVTANERLASAPDIPTAAESGMPELLFSSWYGVWAPKGLAVGPAARLSLALANITQEEEFRKQLAAIGVSPLSEGRAAFTRSSPLMCRRTSPFLKVRTFSPSEAVDLAGDEEATSRSHIQVLAAKLGICTTRCCRPNDGTRGSRSTHGLRCI